MQFFSLFTDVTKLVTFCRTKGVSHVIYEFFESSLANVRQ